MFRNNSLSALAFVTYALIQLAVPSQSLAQGNACVRCHLDSADFSTMAHLVEWDDSTHGQEGVGCHACHGGDPLTTDLSAAHAEILSSTNPASPVHAVNLPSTCGSCHVGPLLAFEESRHFGLLAEGDPWGPTCASCHGSVAAERPTPRAVEQLCTACHGLDGPVPRPGRPARARAALARIVDARQTVVAMERIIGRLPADRRSVLDQSLSHIEQPLGEASDEFHRFVFDEVDAQLVEAHEQIDDLIDRLLTPDTAETSPSR